MLLSRYHSLLASSRTGTNLATGHHHPYCVADDWRHSGYLYPKLYPAGYIDPWANADHSADPWAVSDQYPASDGDSFGYGNPDYFAEHDGHGHSHGDGHRHPDGHSDLGADGDPHCNSYEYSRPNRNTDGDAYRAGRPRFADCDPDAVSDPCANYGSDRSGCAIADFASTGPECGRSFECDEMTKAYGYI